MTHQPLQQPYPFGGGLLGGYRDPFAQAQSNAPDAASAANARAAMLAAYQAALTQANSRYAGYGPIGSIGAAEAAPKPAIEDAGLRAGEIIGWRIWRVERGALYSIFADFFWPFGEPVVTSEKDVEGGLGVFAFKTQQQVLAQYGRTSTDIVVGTAFLWGLVIEHERGYRAEFAKPASLVAYMGDDWPLGEEKLTILRKRYGLPA